MMATKNMMMRNDTILGVCEALGEDFGFNANILRVALILPIFWFPMEMLALYLALGVAVFASRTLFPAKQPQQAAPVVEARKPAIEAPANQDVSLEDAA
ncbi:PspC domain-containing protein [Sphingomicrobium sediminis]|uniref:PspC domain-containing protein n=1 Tax=Sphingomicrobium sediminis TaxID=2950949 RepID=A0A9X2J446_9SPHN|nr:PspC domain-containing protein [Sphingomicrobium sediminis]MCM8556857.1 PspC domain-containing protein [Sphingomicrobium sediminis]